MPIVVTHQAGLRFAAQVGEHELILDQPLRSGGHDAGPSPLELLGAGLGGCVALYVHQFLVARSLDASVVRVEVTTQHARNPSRIARFDVRVVIGGDVPAAYKPMILSVARVCPVYNTLVRGADIGVAVELTPVAAGAMAP